MKPYRQIDCFTTSMKYWKFLGIYPSKNMNRYYKIYSKVIVTIFILLYTLLTAVNFYFLPRQMDLFIEEMIFFFTEVTVAAKVLSFWILKDKIIKMFDILETDIFLPTTKAGLQIIARRKKSIIRFWNVNAAISYISYFSHIFSPLLAHIFMGVDLVLPVCTYSFLSESFIRQYVYPLYFYQLFGMHCNMLTNLNTDTFIVGLMILAMAQLEILDGKLRGLTNEDITENEGLSRAYNDTAVETNNVRKLNECARHFKEVAKYCNLIESAFGLTLFVQLSVSSIIICVCLFRFTLPAPGEYYIFLMTYVFVMIMEILVPCWFGTRVIDMSSRLSVAIYNCKWMPRSPQFKSSFRFFVERMNRPLSIVACKMFPLSLATFSSIMNTAYSFFTLLRHMQRRQNDKDITQ